MARWSCESELLYEGSLMTVNFAGEAERPGGGAKGNGAGEF